MSTPVAAIHGEFNSTQEDWTSYTERLQQYFTANDIAEAKHRAILLSACGIATYLLINSSRKSCRKDICSVSQIGRGAQ